MMARVVLGIGSNLNRRRHIQRGIEALRERFGQVDLSPVYRSESVGFQGPEFFNLVAIIKTDLSVDALHAELRTIEESEGRSRAGDHFSSRTLDIDILLYDDAVLRANGYDIPRAEILEYAFVLKPLSEILPEAQHPENGATFADLWRNFRRTNGVGSLSRSPWAPT